MAPPVAVGASPRCDQWLAMVRPHLPELLVDSAALERWRAVARHLPGDALGAFELRLAKAATQVDFSVRLDRPDLARDAGRWLAAPHLAEVLGAWANEPSAWRSISAFWLEFDLDPLATAAGPPAPVVCCQLRQRVDAEWLARTLVPALRGRPLDGPGRRLVERCVRALPEGAKVLYAFALLSRPGQAVRLELYGLRPAAMAEYLATHLSPAAAGQVAPLQSLIVPGERYHLSFDIDDRGLLPRLGVEVSYVRLPHREPAWADLFQRLVDAGLCDPAKRDAVLAWPGQDTPRSRPRHWPASVAPGHLVRCLSHVKLVTWPDRPPEAKAYLLMQYLPRQPAQPPGPVARTP